MPQIFLKPSDISGETFSIKGPEAHHLIRVLRRKVNDHVIFFDGQGRRYNGVLTRIDEELNLAEGRITQTTQAREKQYQLRLFQGLPRGSKFDYVIEKATELGIDDVYPFISQKSLIRPSVNQLHLKLSRWKRLVHAAAKQCNRATIPEIHPEKKWLDLSAELKSGVTIVFSHGANSRSFREIIAEILSSSSRDSAIINLVVGPESGFSPQEIRGLVEGGSRLASLGERTLRTETAGLAALAILNYELGML